MVRCRVCGGSCATTRIMLNETICESCKPDYSMYIVIAGGTEITQPYDMAGFRVASTTAIGLSQASGSATLLRVNRFNGKREIIVNMETPGVS